MITPMILKAFNIQRYMIFVVVIMLITFWLLLGYGWSEYNNNEKIKRDKLNNTEKLLLHSDSTKTLIIHNQIKIIDKLDSILKFKK